MTRWVNLLRHVGRSAISAARRRADWVAVVSRVPLTTSVGWRARIEGRRIAIGSRCIVEDGAAICARHAIACRDERVTIGDDCRVSAGARIYSWGGFVAIGSHCSVNAYAVLYGTGGGISIGNHVRIAAHAVIVTANHRFGRLDIPIAQQGVTAEPIVIEEDVWIGTGARVLGGVRIGHGSVVAAGAVVTRDVEPFSVVGGVPAVLIRKRTGEAPPSRA